MSSQPATATNATAPAPPSSQAHGAEFSAESGAESEPLTASVVAPGAADGADEGGAIARCTRRGNGRETTVLCSPSLLR